MKTYKKDYEDVDIGCCNDEFHCFSFWWLCKLWLATYGWLCCLVPGGSLCPKPSCCKSSDEVEETDIELKQDASTSEDEEETYTHVETDKQDNINIDDHLRNINKKLNNVLTKDDTNFIKQIIQETVNEIKETLLASVLHRVETVEGELHDLAIKNETLKKEIKNLTKTNKTNEDKHKQELT